MKNCFLIVLILTFATWLNFRSASYAVVCWESSLWETEKEKFLSILRENKSISGSYVIKMKWQKWEGSSIQSIQTVWRNESSKIMYAHQSWKFSQMWKWGTNRTFWKCQNVRQQKMIAWMVVMPEYFSPRINVRKAQNFAYLHGS